MVRAFYPATLAEALLLRRENPEAKLIAGGTDLMVAKPVIDSAIFITDIQELAGISLTETETAEGGKTGKLVIGACSRYSDLEANPLIPDMIRECVSQIAAPGIRNAGTIGGNICNASPAGDTLPVLYALSANLRLAAFSADGHITRREMPISEFMLGVRKTALAPEEILEAVVLDTGAWKAGTKTAYRKIAARNAQAISKVSFAGLCRFEAGRVSDFSAAFGSVGATVIRAADLEASMIGLTSPEFKAAAAAMRSAYAERIHPIDDQRSTAVYRKTVCLNLLEAFIKGNGAL